MAETYRSKGGERVGTCFGFSVSWEKGGDMFRFFGFLGNNKKL